MAARLDSLLVIKKIVTSRERAKELIKSGKVIVNSKACTKPSQIVDEEADIKITGEVLKYVGRGGLKLEKAIKHFSIDLTNKVCADIGASTGGFTDCMLINGAQKVYAVDVGCNQLADKIKNDERVINLEGVNVRYLTPEQIREKLDFISVDVSFISLTLVLSILKSFLKENGEMVCLIKPQFEAGKENIGKKGVIKSQKIHFQIINNMIQYINDINLSVNDITFSPIKGSEGNIEYLFHLVNSKNIKSKIINIGHCVDYTFKTLKSVK